MDRMELSVQEAAIEIEKQFDAMLYDGMPSWELIQVEEARRAAHDDLVRQVIGTGFRKLSR